MSLKRLSPLAALASLWLLAAWPMLRAGYPSIGDGLNHLYRLVEFDHLLRGGVWYPRWATDLGYGYGYPLFNFYSPLIYYLGALLHAFGPSFGDSLLAVYVLALGLAIGGAYALARARWGATAGLIAAAAYALAPYLYFDFFARGALPETLGLALLPWLLWACVRLGRRPTAASFIAASALWATLIFTHLLSALLAGPLIVLFAAFGLAAGPREKIAARSIRFVGALLLGLGLAALFWLPAVWETRHVQIGQLTTPGDLDFHNNFLPLAVLFAWPRTFDPRLVFVELAPSLSLAALLIAAAGRLRQIDLPGLQKADRSWLSAWQGWETGLVLAFIALALFTHPLTVGVWERLPLADIIQFPWRLVGPLSLLLALLGAAGAGRTAPRAALLLLPLLYFYSLPWTFSGEFSVPAAPTVRDLTAYELTGQLGSTSAGEFLPRDVRTLPDPRSLSPLYEQHLMIDRLGALPTGVTPLEQSATLTSASATVEAQAPATITFTVFYFPGWRATVDGEPAPITPSQPNGLITVNIPAGQHTVGIEFGDTPVRTLGWVISAFSLAALLGLALRLRAAVPASAANPLTREKSQWPFAGAALALLVVRIVFIDGHDTFFSRTRFDGATVRDVDQPLDINFDNQLVLIGLDCSANTVAADEPLSLTLYWRAQNPPAADYSTTVQVVDADGHLFGQADSQHPGRMPTSRWRLDQYARDPHTLTLFPGTPPGAYRLIAGVYQFGGGALSVLDASQTPHGSWYDLGPITITRARRAAQPTLSQPLNLPLGPLTLLGVELSQTEPAAGDEITLTFYWQANAGARPDASLNLELVTVDGAVARALTVPPARADYPTSGWLPGEIVRAPVRLRIPAAAPGGPAGFRATLLDATGARLGGPESIARVNLRVPERSFVIPGITHPRSDEFGGVIKLLGYDLTADGLTLYWQALAPIEASYKVFVHALAADGFIQAQVDAFPLNGTRPTTGWLPGEVLTEHYTIDLPQATSIEVGLYDPRTLGRLGAAVFTP